MFENFVEVIQAELVFIFNIILKIRNMKQIFKIRNTKTAKKYEIQNIAIFKQICRSTLYIVFLIQVYICVRKLITPKFN